MDFLDLVGRQVLPERADERDAAADAGLEVEIETAIGGKLQ